MIAPLDKLIAQEQLLYAVVVIIRPCWWQVTFACLNLKQPSLGVNDSLHYWGLGSIVTIYANPKVYLFSSLIVLECRHQSKDWICWQAIK